MRSVQLVIDLPGIDPDTAFAAVGEFGRFPDLAPAVRSVEPHEGGSDWEVYFRNGILRWTETDRSDETARTIDFAQADGDFESFAGRWHVLATDRGARVDFTTDFDFGIPSLVGILDPVAERVIKETISLIVIGLFPVGTVVGDTKLADRLASLTPPATTPAGAA